MNGNCILERVNETGSTNDDLMARWRSGELIDPVARMAKHQLRGKGRAGRIWHAVPDDSLAFSLAYPFHKSPSELSGLSLFAGLAVIDGLCAALNTNEPALYERGFRLKWPNDMLIGNAKLGGILIEGGQSTLNDPTWMIIGVGINLRSAQLETISSDAIASVEQLLSPDQALPDREFIWLKLVEAFECLLNKFDQRGFTPFLERWSRWDALQGQIVFTSASEKNAVEGIASGIDHTGAYRIQTQGNMVTIHAGDVSLRKKS